MHPLNQTLQLIRSRAFYQWATIRDGGYYSVVAADIKRSLANIICELPWVPMSVGV